MQLLAAEDQALHVSHPHHHPIKYNHCHRQGKKNQISFVGRIHEQMTEKLGLYHIDGIERQAFLLKLLLPFPWLEFISSYFLEQPHKLLYSISLVFPFLQPFLCVGIIANFSFLIEQMQVLIRYFDQLSNTIPTTIARELESAGKKI